MDQIRTWAEQKEFEKVILNVLRHEWFLSLDEKFGTASKSCQTAQIDRKSLERLACRCDFQFSGAVVHWTDEEVALLRSMHADNKSAPAIAKALKCKKQRVLSKGHALGLQFCLFASLTPEQIDAYKKLRLLGRSASELNDLLRPP